MTTNLTAVIAAAVKALPRNHKVRKDLETALAARAAYVARGRKAAATRAKARKSRGRR